MTVNAGIVYGGEARNTVAPEPRVLSIYVTPHPNKGWVNLHRPQKTPTEGSDNLHGKTRALGRLLGQELGVTDSGEGTDGSLTYARGLPKFDSPGIAGAGAHANQNQIRDPDLIYPGQVFMMPEGDRNWPVAN